MILKRLFKNALKLAVTFSIFFTACNFENLFEPTFNDGAKDFFKEYTENAAIEEHTLTLEPYSDGAGRSCVSSLEGNLILDYFMRNPQQYTLEPSVTFSSLDESIDRSAVNIIQSELDHIILTIPQTLLVDSDEGKNISPTISLYEPKSGRNFRQYEVDLYCNSKPPELNNPTILNDSNTTFVIAFDMPSQAELALRHKDLTTITINDKSYPVSVDEEGNFSFSDSSFSTSKKDLITIGNKTFDYTDRSVYYTTDDSFTEGDKEYTVIILDSAGLSSKTTASTKITKLNSPSITNVSGKSVESKYNTDYNSETNEYTPKTLPVLGGKEFTKVTITPPTEDNEGGTVTTDDMTVYYSLFNGTPKVAKQTKSGSFSGNETLELELAVGSWYLETYATKTNYEKSSKAISFIRVVDSYLFIGEDGSDDDTEADGTDTLPYATIAKAIADINSRKDSSVEYTILIGGNVAGEANTDTIVASGLIITSTNSASSDTLTTFNLASGIPITITGLKVTNLTAQSTNNITVSEDAVITNATVQNGATLKIDSNALINEVTLVGNGTLTITGDLSQETAATITPAVYANGEKVLADSDYLAANYSKVKVKQNNDDTVWTVTSEGRLTETAARNISIDVIQQETDITVTPAESPVAASSGIVTFTADSGYDSYSWTVDGTEQTTATPNILELDTTNWVKGVYDVYLEATKDTVKYSYHAQIKIN